MRQSNGYIILFSVIMTVVIGGGLAAAYNGLKGKIERNEDIEKKTNILMAVVDIAPGTKPEAIEEMYGTSIEGVVIDKKGSELAPDQILNDRKEVIEPQAVDVQKQFKKMKDAAKKGEDVNVLLPLFKYKSKVDTSKTEAYIIPMFGSGLWDWVNGYIAISAEDGKTVKGVVFGHKSETPGLGARITEAEVQSRFVGREIYKDNGTVGLEFMKGEGNSIQEDKVWLVDGLSGASMTTGGVNKMLEQYLSLYGPYLKSQAKANAQRGGTGSSKDAGNYMPVAPLKIQ